MANAEESGEPLAIGQQPALHASHRYPEAQTERDSGDAPVGAKLWSTGIPIEVNQDKPPRPA